MNRRIYIAKRPLVRRHLPIRMHVPLAREKHQLLLGELRIDECQRERVKCQVPGGVPGIFPLVRHRDDVGVVQMHPLVIAAAPTFGGRRNLPRIALDPFRHVEIEILLAPDHAGKGLALHELGVGGLEIALQFAEELIGFSGPLIDHAIEIPKRPRRRRARQAHMDADRTLRGHLEAEMRGRLGSFVNRRDGVLAAVNQIFVKAVLEWPRSARRIQPSAVGRIFGQQPLHRGPARAAGRAMVRAEGFMLGDHAVAADAQPRLVLVRLPAPGIAKCELRQQMQGSG